MNQSLCLAPWRARGLGILRIAFGVVWAIDAWFKWQPDFIHNFVDYLTGAQEGQPAAVRAWIGLWINVVHINPHFFAYAVAVGETAVAIGLLFGLFSNATCIVGLLLSVMIWATAEGFGGPYKPGSVDIGSALIYAMVLAALFLTSAGRFVGVDPLLDRHLGRFRFLASG
jgi:uncharacterized membrane protein YphA (DoxX/SURF4 family)